MKFKDKDGNVFEDIKVAWYAWNKQRCEPLSDQMFKTINNLGWVMHNPAEAARLMGYEVIEDGEDINVPAKEDLVNKTDEPPTRQTILEAAMKCVCGDREQDYGSPEESFEVIAGLWEIYMRGKCVSKNADVCILPQDVAAMMALLKIGHIASAHNKTDNWIDLAGYAACGGELEGRE